jgi:hypothetical protein
MKSKFLLILCIIASATTARAALGIVPASFKDDCLPLLKGQEDLLRVVAAFDIEDTGRAHTGYPQAAKFAPFVFLARPKGSKDADNLLFIVQQGGELAMAVGGFKDEPFANRLGIAILPRDLVPPGNPTLYFPK